MPPSGYSQTQSGYAVDFLSSCFQALIKEADEKSISLLEALKIEIGNIKAHLSSENTKPSQEAILKLTLAFYETLFASGKMEEDEIRILAPKTAKQIGIEILAIKVDENAYASL